MNWLKLVLNQIIEIDKNCHNGIKKAFRARARQLITTLYYNGLTYTFALCVARSSENLVFKTNGIADLCQKHIDEEEKVEELSYALYAKCLLNALKELRVNGQDLVKVLDELRTREAELEIEIKSYCEWLKRLAEAKFDKEVG